MSDDVLATETPAVVTRAEQEEARVRMENLAEKCSREDKELQEFRRAHWAAHGGVHKYGSVNAHPDASLSGGRVVELLRGYVRGLSDQQEPRLTFNVLGLVGDARSDYANAMEERGLVSYKEGTVDFLDGHFVVTDLGKLVHDALSELEFPAL
jgi:hypothetical protein